MNLESVLVGLDYNVNEAIVKQGEVAIKAGNFNEPDLNHIINLHEKLKALGGFVALSNSQSVFKIKCESKDEEKLKEFNLDVVDFAKKYNFNIEKLNGKETYYILGKI